MSAARAAAAPRHQPGGGAGRARGQRVKVPWGLVACAHYSDAALAVYIKVAALAQRPEGCTAAVETLATYLGMSKPAVERALTQLINASPDGTVEVPTTRRTSPGGTGTTALRRVRPIGHRELFVWLPVAAADALTPRLLRAYAALAYAHARRMPVTAAELAELLRHHSGARAGLSVGERSARRIMNQLESLGWITVHRRAGHQGRHLVDVHDHPLTSVPPLDTDEGSGPDDHDGSLASKEDHRTDRREKTEAGGTVRRRRDTGKWAGQSGHPVDNQHYYPVAEASPRPYTGPPLTLSPRIWTALAPVRDLLPGISPYLMRRIARETGHQLDTHATTERITERIATRRTGTDQIRDPGRWLLAALTRFGCPDPDCESGWHWTTGRRCTVCAELAADRHRGDHPPHTAVHPTTHTAA